MSAWFISCIQSLEFNKKMTADFLPLVVRNIQIRKSFE